MFFRVPTVVGVIAVCVAVSMLITTVDNRIFRRGEAPSSTGTTNPSSPAAPGSSFTPGNIDDQHWEADRLLRKAQSDGEAASRLFSTWPDVLESLKQGEGADAIAADPQLVEKLSFLTRDRRASSEEIQSLNDRILEVQKRFDELSKHSTPLSAHEIVEIRELQLAAESVRSEWDSAHEQARAVQHLAISRMMPRRNPTLDEELKEANASALVEEIEQRREIAAQRDVERRAKMQELEAKKRLEEERELELERRATSPEIASLLAPFLHSRDVQPRMSGGSLQLRRTFESMPTSLSALRGMGALDKSNDGLKRLAKAGGDRKLSPPKWAVHSQPGNWSQADKTMLQEAQAALVELGPTLVRLGRLSP